MNIFIEDYIIQNLLINLAIFRAVKFTNKNLTSKAKLSIASLLYTLISAYSTLIGYIIIKNLVLIIGSILCIVICFFRNKKNLINNLIFFYIYQFAFLGAFTYFSNSFYIDRGIIFCYKINLNSAITHLIIAEYILEKISKTMILKIKSNNYICKLKITHCNSSLCINAYIDSGNLLNIDGCPIPIISIDCLTKLDAISIVDLFLKNSTIKAGAISGKNNMPMIRLEKIEIEYNHKKTILKNQLTAITNNSFDKQNYQALVSPFILA